jgi:hypothetical protein
MVVQKIETINSIMMIAKTVMADSSAGGRFWFKAAASRKDDRNVTCKERVRMTLYQVSSHVCLEERPFGFQSILQQSLDVLHTTRAKEVIYVRFADNMSAWEFWIPENRMIRTNDNQVNFFEH